VATAAQQPVLACCRVVLPQLCLAW